MVYHPPARRAVFDLKPRVAAWRTARLKNLLPRHQTVRESGVIETGSGGGIEANLS